MSRYWSGSHIDDIGPNEVLVFGANTEGRHGKGLAKIALKFGAEYGIARGICGRTYALITKNLTPGYTEKLTGIAYPVAGERSLTAGQLSENIRELYSVARGLPDKDFLIPYICDPNQRTLNGYDPIWLAGLFTRLSAPNNIVFHTSYERLCPRRD